jgi:hypothetical protein
LEINLFVVENFIFAVLVVFLMLRKKMLLDYYARVTSIQYTQTLDWRPLTSRMSLEL